MRKMNWKLMAACLAAAPWLHAAEPQRVVLKFDQEDTAALETVLDAVEADENVAQVQADQPLDPVSPDVVEQRKTILLVDQGDSRPARIEVEPVKTEVAQVRTDVAVTLDAADEELEPKDVRPGPDVKPREDGKQQDEEQRREAKRQAERARAEADRARGAADRARAKADRDRAKAEAAKARQLARAAVKRQGGSFLGVSTSAASAPLRMQLKLPEGVGLVVDQVVPGSPAEQAGIEQYDVLQKLNEQLLVNPEQFAALVRGRKPGDKVTIELVREGEPMTIKAELAAAPAPQPADVLVPGMPPQIWNIPVPAPAPQIQPFGGPTPPAALPAPMPSPQMPPYGHPTPPMGVMPPPPPPPVMPLPPSPHPQDPFGGPKPPEPMRPPQPGRQPGPSFGFQLRPPSPDAKPERMEPKEGGSSVTVEADGDTIRVTRNGKAWLIRITDDDGIQVSEASSKHEDGPNAKLDKLKRLIVRQAKTKEKGLKQEKHD